MTHPVLWTRALVPAWLPAAYGGCGFAVAMTPWWTWGLMRWQLLVYLGIGFLLMLLAWPQRLEIGAEGLRLHRSFFARRIIPFHAIQRAAPNGPRKLLLQLQSGQALWLDTGPWLANTEQELLERFWGAITAAAQDGPRGIERQSLLRMGRTTAEWRAALREIAKPASYRAATIAHERLWAIAENPGIEREMRGAAIVALASTTIDAATLERLERLDAATVDVALQALFEVARSQAPGDHVIDAVLNELTQ